MSQMKLQNNQCKTCPFRESGGVDLRPERMAEIQSYLLNGTNHMCHSDRSNESVCYGGRQWQLEMWYRLGIITSPTNEALCEAVRKVGIEPGAHITGALGK